MPFEREQVLALASFRLLKFGISADFLAWEARMRAVVLLLMKHGSKPEETVKQPYSYSESILGQEAWQVDLERGQRLHNQDNLERQAALRAAA